MYFWNVVNAFTSLMTSSQVLSIRVIYHRLLQEEVASLWRVMYAKVVRPDNAWSRNIPMEWKLHLSSQMSYPFLQRHDWLSDLHSSVYEHPSYPRQWSANHDQPDYLIYLFINHTRILLSLSTHSQQLERFGIKLGISIKERNRQNHP